MAFLGLEAARASAVDRQFTRAFQQERLNFTLNGEVPKATKPLDYSNLLGNRAKQEPSYGEPVSNL